MTIYVDEREVVFGTYPNGEVISPVLPEIRQNGVNVRLHWTGDEDLLHLALVRGLISQRQELPQPLATLTIDYMPYSRMDREKAGKCFSLKYVANAINSMHWAVVYVVEPHSQVTLDLLQNSKPIWDRTSSG